MQNIYTFLLIALTLGFVMCIDTLFRKRGVNARTTKMDQKVKMELSEGRYKEKPAKKVSKDVDRFGRWSCTLSNGNKVTKMGMLSTIISNSDIISYHEIK